MNMKKAAQFANEAGTGQLDRAQRTAYLNSKGINPGAQFQLDLVFPETIGDREDLRHIPNDYARSSIFTARNKRAARRNFLHEKLFHYYEPRMTKSFGCKSSTMASACRWAIRSSSRLKTL